MTEQPVSLMDTLLVSDEVNVLYELNKHLRVQSVLERYSGFHMRVLAQQRAHAAGTTTVIPEEADDVWALYNIITVGDLVKSVTTRKVSSKKVGGKVAGKNHVTSVTTILTIIVESVEYVPGEALRVHGRNVRLNAYVPIGKYHTLTICRLRKVSVFKNRWDAFSIFTLKRANEAANAETAIVVRPLSVCDSACR